MEFRLLGEVQVRAAGRLLDVGTPRQQAVLAALAVDPGRPVPIETLIDRVWGDEPPAEARNVLYSHLSRIRQLLKQAADLGDDTAGAARAAARRVRARHRPGPGRPAPVRAPGRPGSRPVAHECRTGERARGGVGPVARHPGGRAVGRVGGERTRELAPAPPGRRRPLGARRASARPRRGGDQHVARPDHRVPARRAARVPAHGGAARGRPGRGGHRPLRDGTGAAGRGTGRRSRSGAARGVRGDPAR